MLHLSGAPPRHDLTWTVWFVYDRFLPRHDVATPREVYSRSIVYLNTVSPGGAPIVVWPKAHKAAADIVQQLVSEHGEEEYHGVRWRDEVIAAMAQRPEDADEEAGYDTREVVWSGVGPATEVLMEEGDMVLFEPMSMHSASRCVNGTSRYCWVTSFHDHRVQSMPHKLYQDRFNAEFLERLAPEVKQVTEWLPEYMRDYGDQVLGPETQYWAYDARTVGVDVDALDSDGRKNQAMLSKAQLEEQRIAVAKIRQAAGARL